MAKPSEKGKSNSKPAAKGAVAKVAKYNGVTLPTDATQRRRMRNKLSAQVHRKRKQDALDTARQEAEGCDVVINQMKQQLRDTRDKIASLQSIMDAIAREFGDEAVQHIFQQCNGQEGGAVASDADDQMARAVISDSDNNASSSISSSSDDESMK